LRSIEEIWGNLRQFEEIHPEQPGGEEAETLKKKKTVGGGGATPI